VARDVAELDYFEVEDFANYRPEVKEAIGVEYGGWTIYETPGFAVLLTLKLTPIAKEPFSYARIKKRSVGAEKGTLGPRQVSP
jgi:gamma-glutamyltranspeptidase/glutathione hydrolase